jgi:cytochrome P450
VKSLSGISEIRNQVAVMFLAGHETSASALSWALYLIARDKDVQRRLQAEADAVYSGQGHLKPQQMRQLKFTRDVFREALRLYPPVAFVPRDITVLETLRGKALKRGSAIFVSIWLLHRHRKIWPNPDDFDPDRFTRAEEKQCIREAYLPFSQGPRVCLGASFAMQEAVIILSMIARNFDLSVCPDHTPRPVARLTLRSENGIRLKFSTREQKLASEPENPNVCR